MAPRTDARVTELEFDLAGSDFFLVETSETASCELELEAVVPRSDGTVLEYLAVRGADPDRVSDLLAEARGALRTNLIDRREEEALFEIVTESRLAATLADEGSLFKQITAREGEGTLIAEVPAHIDVGRVIDSFLAEYPDAELLAKRTIDRSTPMMTHSQFRGELVEELTQKQLRTLRLAHARGYFEWPREHTAQEIADELGIAAPTLTQHLRAAERKVFDVVFDR